MSKTWKMFIDFLSFKTNIGEGSPVRELPTTPSDLTRENLIPFPPELTEEVQEPLYVWYSPKWNELRVATKSSGYLFKGEEGELHLCYRLNPPFETSSFYLIGEL